MTVYRKLAGSVATVALVAGSLVAAPIAIGDHLSVTGIAAFAKGNGGGNGGGHGGGGGGGNGGGGHGGGGGNGGGGGHGSASSGSHGNGAGKAGGKGFGSAGFAGDDHPGKQNGRATSLSGTDDGATSKSKHALAAELGKLNAAHASATAFANASENSAVGMVAAYGQEALTGISAEEASEKLGEISNKPVDEDVIAAVDQLIDGKIAAPEDTTGDATTGGAASSDEETGGTTTGDTASTDTDTSGTTTGDTGSADASGTTQQQS